MSCRALPRPCSRSGPTRRLFLHLSPLRSRRRSRSPATTRWSSPTRGSGLQWARRNGTTGSASRSARPRRPRRRWSISRGDGSKADVVCRFGPVLSSFAAAGGCCLSLPLPLFRIPPTPVSWLLRAPLTYPYSERVVCIAFFWISPRKRSVRFAESAPFGALPSGLSSPISRGVSLGPAPSLVRSCYLFGSRSRVMEESTEGLSLPTFSGRLSADWSSHEQRYAPLKRDRTTELTLLHLAGYDPGSLFGASRSTRTKRPRRSPSRSSRRPRQRGSTRRATSSDACLTRR